MPQARRPTPPVKLPRRRAAPPARDALVIGGGVAGLAAASVLAARGLRVTLLEARERLGGRILTLRQPGVALPLELGAEFIHGRPPELLEWLRRAGQLDHDTDGPSFSLRNGRLLPGDDLFAELRRGLGAGRVLLRRRDRSFDELLAALPARALSGAAREFARRLLQGFDAADPADASARAALAEWTGEAAADAPTSRPAGGYGALVEALAASLAPRRVRLELGAEVRRIAWSRGEVRVEGWREGRPFSHRARRAVVSLPLGVLQQSLVGDPARPGEGAGPDASRGLVQFDPLPRALLAPLAQLGPGPVIKTVMVFREAFWERIDAGRYAAATFFQAAGAPVTTFWTARPARAPVIVAWQAGPAAAACSALGREHHLRIALDSFQSLWGRRVDVRAQLQSAESYDWWADPFARGAYSYVRVGGEGARRALARPLQGTLYFAGEACDEGPDAGTVAGALRSGMIAARRLARAAGPVSGQHRARRASTEPM